MAEGLTRAQRFQFDAHGYVLLRGALDAGLIAAASDDPSLIVQVEAQAGDVLLFPESLIHSTTEIRSDRERVILVSGYTPPMLREWPGNEVSPAFCAGLSDDIRPIISGEQSWHWKRLYPPS